MVRALILPRITSHLPSEECNPSQWPHLQGIELADPRFSKPAPIDMLLGSDIFWDILQSGKRCGPSDAPVAIRSQLGWLVAGNVSTSSSKINVHVSEVDLGSRLRQFWELESVPSSRTLTVEERACEEHFKTTHSRDSSGRFTVSIPWKKPMPRVGLSRDHALRRFKSLEKRLADQQGYKAEYIDFMRKYVALGHVAGKPCTQPVGKPCTQPVGKPCTQPVGKLCTKPAGAGKPCTKPVGKPCTQPVGKPCTKPAGKPCTQPAGKPRIQQVGKPCT
jgi:hypothetical protein